MDKGDVAVHLVLRSSVRGVQKIDFATRVSEGEAIARGATVAFLEKFAVSRK